MSAPAAGSGLRFLVGLGLLAAGPLVLFDLLRSSGVLARTDDPVVHLEQSLHVFGLAALAVLGFAAWQRPEPSWRPLPVRRVVGAYVPFVCGWTVLLVAYLWLARTVGHPVAVQPQLAWLAGCDLARPGSWFAIAAIVLLGPCAEEVVFRGYLQPALTGVLGRGPGLAATAVVFGLVHTLPYAAPVGGLGAFFGWLALRHRSLGAAALAHAVHNGLTVLLTVAWPGHLDLLYPR